MRPIVILWCTIRPTLFNSTHKFWIDNAKSSDRITTYVCGFQSDLDLTSGTNLIKIPTVAKGLTKACSYLTSTISKLEFKDNPIFIFASDDFFPPKYWDDILEHEFNDYDGSIVFYDGTDGNNPIVAIPILTYNTLKLLNFIIYHPAYTHLYCDNELYFNLDQLNKLKDYRKTNQSIFFEHRHWSFGKRPIDQQDVVNSSKAYVDERLWQIRSQYSLEDRLTI